MEEALKLATEINNHIQITTAFGIYEEFLLCHCHESLCKALFKWPRVENDRPSEEARESLFWDSPQPKDTTFFLLWLHSSPANQGPPTRDLPLLGLDSVCPALRGYLGGKTFHLKPEQSQETQGSLLTLLRGPVLVLRLLGTLSQALWMFFIVRHDSHPQRRGRGEGRIDRCRQCGFVSPLIYESAFWNGIIIILRKIAV